MKAVVFEEYGRPDVLEMREVAEPVPKADEVLIRVYASSINEWDWSFLQGKPFINRLLYGIRKPRKRILGADVAGQVESIGKDVTQFKPGDTVFGDLWDAWGGFAEYVCAPESALASMPANMSFEQAASAPQAGILAMRGLQTVGRIKQGQNVLINGAGGGVGTFAVQIAKSIGTDVTGVDHGTKLDMIRSLGADHVIDYTREDFTRNGRQYDLILDVAGYRSMFDYKRALRSTGTYVMVGGSTGRILQALVMGLWGSMTRENKRIRLLASRSSSDIAQLKELLEAGNVVPVIDRCYPLDEVPEAYRRFGDGLHKGKIVIKVR